MSKLKVFLTVCCLLVTAQAFAMPFNLTLPGGQNYLNVGNFNGVSNAANSVTLDVKNAAMIQGQNTVVTTDDVYYPTAISTFDISFTVNLGGYVDGLGAPAVFHAYAANSTFYQDVFQLTGALHGKFVDGLGHFVYEPFDNNDFLKLTYRQYDLVQNSYNPAVNVLLLEADSLNNPSQGAVGNYDGETGSFSASVTLKDVVPGYFKTLGGVDFSDISVLFGLSTGNFLQQSFRTTASQGPLNNGLYNITQTNTLTGASVSVTTTPEPASMILLGAGLLGLFVARRRKAAN